MANQREGGLELLTPREMAEADRLAGEAGVGGAALMERAGWAVAQAARTMGRGRVVVLAGPGNNGGDGYVAARLLAGWGWPVAVAALQKPPEGSDAAGAASRWRGLMVAFTPEAVGRADLVIDAVFGAGLSRALEPAVAEVLGAARRVLAVDVPSGLNGGTGQALGAVRGVDRTVTFFRLKPGHLLLPGRTLCGEVVLADIGLPAGVLETIGPQTFRNLPGLWRLPALAPGSHKYTRGHVTLVGGARMTGAARLASDAARHAGAGLATIAAGEAAGIYRVACPAGVIVTEEPVLQLLEDERRRVWVCGPGLSQEEAAAAFPALAAAGRQVVADAGLLTAHKGAPDGLRGATVITPHEGEFSGLFGPVGEDKVAAARRAAQLLSCVVLLKGPDTVIAAPDGRAAINDNAPDWLGTAGSGDVLSGIIAGLLAQGMEAWEAACAGAWLHGRAGKLAGPWMVADEMAGQVREALLEGRSGALPPNPRWGRGPQAPFA